MHFLPGYGYKQLQRISHLVRALCIFAFQLWRSACRSKILPAHCVPTRRRHYHSYVAVSRMICVVVRFGMIAWAWKGKKMSKFDGDYCIDHSKQSGPGG